MGDGHICLFPVSSSLNYGSPTARGSSRCMARSTFSLALCLSVSVSLVNSAGWGIGRLWVRGWGGGGGVSDISATRYHGDIKGGGISSNSSFIHGYKCSNADDSSICDISIHQNDRSSKFVKRQIWPTSQFVKRLFV